MVTSTYGLANEAKQKPQPFLFLHGLYVCTWVAMDVCEEARGLTLGSLSLSLSCSHFIYVLTQGLSLSFQLTDWLD